MAGGQPATSDDNGLEAIDPLELLLRSALTQSSSNDESSIDQLKIALSPEEQKEKMNSIAEIFQLDEDVPKDDEEMDVDEEDTAQIVDLEDQERRTERLRGAMSALAQLWWASSDQMDIAVEKLADGSRERKPPDTILSSLRQSNTSTV
jgi:hypothetical protein